MNDASCTLKILIGSPTVITYITQGNIFYQCHSITTSRLEKSIYLMDLKLITNF